MDEELTGCPKSQLFTGSFTSEAEAGLSYQPATSYPSSIKRYLTTPSLGCVKVDLMLSAEIALTQLWGGGTLLTDLPKSKPGRSSATCATLHLRPGLALLGFGAYGSPTTWADAHRVGVLWSSLPIILFAVQECPAASPLVLAALHMTATFTLNSQARSGKQCSH